LEYGRLEGLGLFVVPRSQTSNTPHSTVSAGQTSCLTIQWCCASDTPHLRRIGSQGADLHQEHMVARMVSFPRVCRVVMPGFNRTRRPRRAERALVTVQPHSTLGTVYAVERIVARARSVACEGIAGSSVPVWLVCRRGVARQPLGVRVRLRRHQISHEQVSPLQGNRGQAFGALPGIPQAERSRLWHQHQRDSSLKFHKQTWPTSFNGVLVRRFYLQSLAASSSD
jgi:hypothetical protein